MRNFDWKVPSRALRNIRLRDALHLDGQQGAGRPRDQILPRLVRIGATGHRETLDSLPLEVVEAATGAGLAHVDETVESRVASLILAARPLAQDGQLARLLALREDLIAAAMEISLSQPVYSALIWSFADLLAARSENARARLARLLGLGSSTLLDRRLPNTNENLVGLAIANGVREWLTSGDLEALDEARTLAIETSAALGLNIASLLFAFAQTAARLRLEDVTLAAHGPHANERLVSYLRGRRLSAIFPGQREALLGGALTQSAIVLGMPTSSGKTLVAEVRIAAELTSLPKRSVVYLAPYRLLARQVEGSLRDGLRPLAATVRDVGGSFDVVPGDEIASTSPPDVAVMTPERFDALLRVSRSSRRGADETKAFLAQVGLVIFDEVQVVARPGRGARLELMLARTRQALSNADFLGLSGLQKGAELLATWLTGKAPLTAGRRPTGLVELFWHRNGRLVERSEQGEHLVAEIPRAHAPIEAAAQMALMARDEYAPVLIVETRRAEAESVVRKILSLAPAEGGRWRSSLPADSRQALDEAAEDAALTFGAQHHLAELLQAGLGYHHAGVPGHLLRRIEDLAHRRALRVLSATTTVAEGADLPVRFVLIPHLNFEGPTGRLEPDLYFNIAGRSGRAGTAAEGVVVLFESDSRDLMRYAARELFVAKAETQVLHGQLLTALASPNSPQDFAAEREVRGQVLAWLGDKEWANDDNQSHEIASSTLTWQHANPTQRLALEQSVADVLGRLESQGLAVSGSAYRLTPLGARARLAGLAAESCLRLHRELSTTPSTLPERLSGMVRIDGDVAQEIAGLCFETVEVLEKGLWFSRLPGSPRQKVAALRALAADERAWPRDSALFQNDVRLLASWILGLDYGSLEKLAPTFDRGLFEDGPESARAADAAVYFGNLAYAAAWAWSGAAAMMGGLGDALPSWLRQAIEWGVASESAVELMQGVGVSRRTAMTLSSLTSPAWLIARQVIPDFGPADLLTFELGHGEVERLMRWADSPAARE